MRSLIRGRVGTEGGMLIAALITLAVIYVVPIVALVGVSFEDGGAAYGIVGSSPVYMNVLVNTFRFALIVTGITLIVSYPIAYFARTSTGWRQGIILLLATAPLWTSLLVRTYAWLAILGRRGMLNSFLIDVGLIERPLELSRNSFGAYLGSVYIMVPLMVLTLYTAMRDVDMSTVTASRTLGASPAQGFIRVFLPQSLPGVISGSLLIFIVSLGFFVTPALLGGPADRTFSMLISQQVNQLADFETASALSLILMVVTIAALVAFAAFVGFDQFIGGHLRSQRPSRLLGVFAILGRIARLGGPVTDLLAWRPLWWVIVGGLLIWLVFPFLVIVPLSFSGTEYLQYPIESWSLRWYEDVITGNVWPRAAVASILVGIGATILAIFAGVMGALGMRQAPRSVQRASIILFMAPAMIPTMIFAIAAFYAAVRVGLADTVLGLAIAHAALALPYVVVMVSTALVGMNRWVEPAARSLGAGPFMTLRRVTLPLLAPALVLAAVVAFQTSFDEVVVALFVSGLHTRTLPKQMWQASTLEVSPSLFAVGVLVVLAVVAVALVGLLLNRALSRR